MDVVKERALDASKASVSDYYILTTYKARPIRWHWQQDYVGRQISRNEEIDR